MIDMSDGYQLLESLMESAISSRAQPPSADAIREEIECFRKVLTTKIRDEDAERLARELEARHGVTMRLGSTLQERKFAPWLDTAKAGIDPYYWTRYVKLLSGGRLSRQVIASLDQVTDRTLGLLEDPRREGMWDRRGMVVGHVQSGKTGNYTGLICKAADAGYRVIIVIAGIHNNLRNQTQIRIDEGFVGRDSARTIRQSVGVGRFDARRRPITFTTSVRDFNKATASAVGVPLHDLNEPAVFVIKKNASTLKSLIEWLRSHSARGGDKKIGEPMLLIDDEADNASINIAHGSGAISRINSQIRELLQLFERSAYIGYTATPFANIFVDPDSDDEMLGDDLFPRSFIVSLDPPTNYFGPRRVFLDPDEPSVIRTVADSEDLLPLKHKRDLRIVGLPNSLQEAICAFVVSKAIRTLRGQGAMHHSMLVNASRFTDVQKQLGNEIHLTLTEIAAAVRLHAGLSPQYACQDRYIAQLRAVFDAQYGGAGHAWQDVQGVLVEAVAPMRVAVINSKSSDTLPYKEHDEAGLSIIAVGGFSLSRGLTLEGLAVSYFLRNSMMYDTLMQMGRWFGYREGYADLCRIWMPEDAEGWYTHIAESIEDLRDELRYMEVSGATPKDFGLRVRSHPDTLLVTARNKMGTGERMVVSVGLSNSFLETAILKRTATAIQANRNAVRSLARECAEDGAGLSSSAKEVPGGYLLRAAPVRPILNFLEAFVNHEDSQLTASLPIRSYINARQHDELAEWDVFFPSLTREDDSTFEDTDLLGLKIRCQQRTAGTASTADTLRVTNKQRVSSRGVEKMGLSAEAAEAAEAAYRLENPELEKPNINYPDRIYRKYRSRPLLIVHLLKINDVSSAHATADANGPIVAWSISFPRTNHPENRVEYVVNTTWLREQLNDGEDDEEEDSGND